MTVTKIFYFGLFLSLSNILSCAHTNKVPPQKSNLTPGVINSKIIKGQTSQNDILQLIGHPNLITKNKAGEEVWTYSKQSFDSKAKGKGLNLLLFANVSAVSSSASSTFDLMITFNSQKRVKDYSMVSTQF